MTALGYNYRITDIQTALGISQLKKLDKFAKARQQAEFKGTLEEFARTAKFDSDELKKSAEAYPLFIAKAKEETSKQYQLSAEIIGKFQKPFLLVPGNWDTKNFWEHLAKYCIPEKGVETIQDIELAGYGSSPERMIGFLPLDVELPFSDRQVFDYLSQFPQLDIAVTHCPPLGYADKSKLNGSHSGSRGIAEYLLKAQPTLILSGHTHVPDVARPFSIPHSHVICAGNLCSKEGYVNELKDVDGGYFNVIELDENGFLKSSEFYQIKEIKKDGALVKPLGKFEPVE